MKLSCSLVEMMCIQAARELVGGGVAFVGQGLPVLSTTLTKLHHDPTLVFTTELGIADWDPPAHEIDHAPVSIAEPILTRGAAYVGDMVDALGSLLMGGRVDIAALSAAEIDRFGNLNALMIGDDYARPDVRFPGTAGNTDGACLARRMLVVMSFEPRRFVDRVSFNTSPGYVSGPGAREAAGLAPQGPNVVVSTVGVFGYDTPDGGRTGSCEMRLRKVYSGVDPETVAVIAPWTVQPGETIETCPPATEEEIAALRALDPAKAYLQEGRY